MPDYDALGTYWRYKDAKYLLTCIGPNDVTLEPVDDTAKRGSLNIQHYMKKGDFDQMVEQKKFKPWQPPKEYER